MVSDRDSNRIEPRGKILRYETYGFYSGCDSIWSYIMDESNITQNQNDFNQETNDFSKQLAECQTQVNEWKDRALRTTADYENFKKRSEKERLMWISNAQSSVLLDLISIVDDFDRAFASVSSHPQPPLLQSYGGQAEEQRVPGRRSLGEGGSKDRAGFELIYKSLQKILQKYGVQEIKDVAQFDPVKHEAIMQVESADHKQGDIVQVLEKGYTFKGEVLRPAKVSVAK